MQPRALDPSALPRTALSLKGISSLDHIHRARNLSRGVDPNPGNPKRGVAQQAEVTRLHC